MNDPYVTDHLANERTFLAWIRTSIGVMAFGFVVEKFALFIKQIGLLLKKDPSIILQSSPQLQGFSSTIGVFLVILGGLISLLAFLNFKKVKKQIESNTYSPSMLLIEILTISIILVGILLAIYLSKSI